jgi:RNA polymerase sigma-70 factor (ECF subfamily)
MDQPSIDPRLSDELLGGLLRAAAAGDAQAFEALYTATVHHALAVVREEAATPLEDVLTECYLHAWRCAAKFDGDQGTALGWLLEMIRSCARTATRPVEVSP